MVLITAVVVPYSVRMVGACVAGCMVGAVVDGTVAVAVDCELQFSRVSQRQIP